MKQLITQNIDFVVAAALILGLVIMPTAQPRLDTAHAATLNDLVNKKTELQKQIEAKQKEAADKKAAADAEKKRQADLNAAIAKLSKDISATENRVNQTQNAIVDTQSAIVDQIKKINDKEDEITKKKEDVNESAVELHIAQDQGGSMLSLFASDRISSAIDRITALNSLSDKLVADVDDLDRQRQDLLAQKASLEQKQQDLTSQKNQLATYQQALGSQKDQKATMVDQSKQAQASLLAQAADANKVSQDLKKQFASVAAEEEAMRRQATQIRPGSNVVRDSAPPSSYGLIWPVGGSITTYFGGSTPFQRFHTGFDIAGPAGDPVKAAASGTVSLATKMCCSSSAGTVDQSYGYGNYIMIKHDNGLVTLYGHLMAMTVAPGQHVDRGQVIAYRGGALGMPGAGWSTGAHLHFEVRDSQGPDDPGKYLP